MSPGTSAIVRFLGALDDEDDVVEDELPPDDAAPEDADDDEELELPQAASARADATAVPSSSALRLTAGLVTDFICTALSFD